MNIKDNFFVIDSENFENAESKLYGYCIADTNVDGGGYNTLLNDEKLYTKTCDGAFVAVQNFKDKVCISQDFIGSWGLYLFRSGGYWAVSNSFLYLVEYLKTRFMLTANVDYMKLSILYGLCSCLPQETAVKEIEMLPRDVSVVVDKNYKKLDFFKKETDESVFELSTKEGVEVLDKWFLKWTRFIKDFCPKIDYKTQTDLSGGFESRMVLMLFLCSGIDVSKIRVNSANDNLHCHTEDFGIASMIANHFGFTLNGEPIKIERGKFSLKDAIDSSFYVKLGFHKEMYWKTNWAKETAFKFTGSGANLKEDAVLDFTLEEFLANQKRKQDNLKLGFNLYGGFEKCVGNCEDFLLKKYGNLDGKRFGRRLYQEGRNRHHYGKAMVVDMLANTITFTPMLDSLIQKLKFNYDFPNLIPAVMFTRYCPDLLNFKFEGKRFVNQETLELAKEINEKFPFKPEDYSENFDDFKIIFEKNDFEDSKNPCKLGEPLDWCKKVYDSQFVKQNFKKFFPKSVYDYAENYRKTHGYFPLSEVYAVIAIAKIAHDCEISLDLEKKKGFEFLNAMAELPDDGAGEEENLYGFAKISSALEILHIARLDIKLENPNVPKSGIALEVLSPKEKCKATTPQWFSKNGTGYVVECSGYEMELKIKALNDGVLKFFLRAKDVRKNGERIPFFVDYEDFCVGKKTVFSSVKPCSHDKPFRYEKKVRAGEEIKIKLSWNAHKYAVGEDEEILKKVMER